MQRTASGYLCRQWIGPTCAATIVFAVVGGVGLVATQLLRASALPSRDGLTAIGVATIPILGEWVVPLGALAGLTLLLSRWRGEGEWLALQAAGVAGRHLLPAALAGGLLLAVATGLLSQFGAPWGRSSLFAVLTEEVRPLPGRATSLGGLTVLPGAADSEGLVDLLLAWESPEGVVVASAVRGDLAGGRSLSLEDGQVIGPQGLLSFDRLSVPLPAVHRRPPPSAWSGSDLAQSSDPYHQAIRHKRVTWPLAGAVLVLLAVPGTLTGRSWTVPGAVVLWWALVRSCDGLAPLLGGLLSAGLPLMLMGFLTGLAWFRWGQR